MIKCDQCGVEFSRSSSAMKLKNYCSRACSDKSRRVYHTCDYWGIKYRKRLSRKKGIGNIFCSRDCYIKSETSTNTCKCATCGKEFPRKKSRERFKKTYCSFNWYVSRKSILKKVNCSYCNTELIRKPSRIKNSENQFCDSLCQGKFITKRVIIKCEYCGEAIERTPSTVSNINFCDKNCLHGYYENCLSQEKIDIHNRIRASKEYIDWRNATYKRDNYTCKMCGKRSEKGMAVVINAHHIRKFSEYPELRFIIENGITLCDSCHKRTYSKEHTFEWLFNDILANGSYLRKCEVDYKGCEKDK